MAKKNPGIRISVDVSPILDEALRLAAAKANLSKTKYVAALLSKKLKVATE